MHPYPFSYHRPASVTEAVALLTEHGDNAKLLAGGHSLLPVMKLRLAHPEHLIDISSLTGLDTIDVDGGSVRIGALTTHHAIETSDVLKADHPLLPLIATTVGDTQVRNRGTIGGALAHADPAADYPAGVLVLDASVNAIGPNGEREIPIAEFFVGFLTTALAADEVITAITLPALAPATGVAYEKLANPASGYAIVGVAARITRNGDSIDEIAVALTGVGDVAYRATAVENALRGTAFSAESVKSVVATVTNGIDVLADIHAPADYRARVAQNLTARAIQHAWENAQT